MGNQPTTFIDTSCTSANKSVEDQGHVVDNSSSPILPSSPVDGFVKKLSLSRLTKGRGKKKNKGQFYAIPPNAERPSPPSKPEVFQDQDQYFILRWDPPAFDGGCPLMGYIIQHLELGLPQLANNPTPDQDDTEAWYSSDPGHITQPECILNNLVPGTTYQFRIVAENLLGYSQPSEVSDPIVFNPHGELDDWFYGPVMTQPLDDVYTVMEHEMLTLSVEIKGQPYPMVHWYNKNDEDMGKLGNPRYKTKSTGFTRTLVISSVELSDAGGIKCVAANQEGVVECFTEINVEAPPRIRRVHNPEFLQNPYDVNDQEEERLTTMVADDYEDLIFQTGELVRLKFLFAGAPKPDLSIYHNGSMVGFDPRIITEFADKLVTIRIENISRSDRGEWLFKLENVLGDDCASLIITVTDHPSPPGAPEILQLSDNTCILRWDVPIDDGGCPVHNYIVEYFRSEWGVWLKAITSKTPGTKIKDLIPGSKYRFRVKAENLYGVSEASEESAEILITDSPSRKNEGSLMPSVQESAEDEEEPMEILSHSDFLDAETLHVPEPPPKKIERKRRPSPRPPHDRDGNLGNIPSQNQITDDPNKKVYSRGDVIRSAVTSTIDYVQRLISETAPQGEGGGMGGAEGYTPRVSTPEDEYEYDFEKLQREYEEEIEAYRQKLERTGTTDEEAEEEEESEGEQGEGPSETKKKDIQPESTTTTEDTEKAKTEEAKPEPSEKPEEGSEGSEEESEEEELPYWTRRRLVRTDTGPRGPMLGDRFQDYLSMKARRSLSLKSLNSSSTGSRDNIRAYAPDPSEDPDSPANIGEIRKAICLQEQREEEERILREKLKEEAKREAEIREAELEAKRRAYRMKCMQQGTMMMEGEGGEGQGESEKPVVRNLLSALEDSHLDPDKASKLAIGAILSCMIPLYLYYGVLVMLLGFVVLVLLWNKFKRYLVVPVPPSSSTSSSPTSSNGKDLSLLNK